MGRAYPPGARNYPSAAASARAAARRAGSLARALEPAELELLDAAGRSQLGFPRSFLESPDVRQLVYGDTWERLVRS